MAAKAPAARVPGLGHLRGAEAHLVDRADVPGAMVIAGRGGLRESDKMMIAAMHAVQEGDRTGMIRDPQTQRLAVELQRGVDIGREEEGVRHSPRAYGRNFPRMGRLGRPGIGAGDSGDLALGELFSAGRTQ